MDIQNANPVKQYKTYLDRLSRKDNRGMWFLHQLALSREVARDYGLTEEQIKDLDETLK